MPKSQPRRSTRRRTTPAYLASFDANIQDVQMAENSGRNLSGTSTITDSTAGPTQAVSNTSSPATVSSTTMPSADDIAAALLQRLELRGVNIPAALPNSSPRYGNALDNVLLQAMGPVGQINHSVETVTPTQAVCSTATSTMPTSSVTSASPVTQSLPVPSAQVAGGSACLSSMAGPSTNHYSSSSLQLVASSLFRASLAPSTSVAYKRVVSKYQEFCSVHFPDVPVFPSTLPMVMQFIAHMFVSNYSAATIASYISAISFSHKASQFPDPTVSFIIKKMLKGVDNIIGRSDARLPITKVILHKLIHAVSVVIGSVFHRHLLKAMFLLAFHAFLRIGEITAPVSVKQATTIQFSSVSFLYGQGQLCGLSLKLTNYKHNYHHPKTINIQCQPNKDFCPVFALHAYLHMAKHVSGPLFQFPDGTAVSRAYFNSSLKSILTFIGLNTQFYKGHSFRIGAATSAAASGVPPTVIQNMGRWKSDAFKHYIRIHNFSA